MAASLGKEFARLAFAVFLRRAEEAASVHDVQDVRRIAEHGGNIVRDHEDGDAVALVEILDELVHLLCDLGVEARDGLVQEQHGVRRAQRPCEQDALLLAARKLAVTAFFERGDAQPFHLFCGKRSLLFGIEGAEARLCEEAREDDLSDGGGEVALDGRLLGQIADGGAAEGIAAPDGAAKVWLQP